MTSVKVSRRSTSRRDPLFKSDHLRPIDHWISYFGDLPSSPWTSRPVRDAVLPEESFLGRVLGHPAPARPVASR